MYLSAFCSLLKAVGDRKQSLQWLRAIETEQLSGSCSSLNGSEQGNPAFCSSWETDGWVGPLLLTFLVEMTAMNNHELH